MKSSPAGLTNCVGNKTAASVIFAVEKIPLTSRAQAYRLIENQIA
jgi:hypothetical protein